MTAQIATAKTADEEEERAMKRRGLLVSAHIPQAASQLDLARGKLGAGGRFSEALVTATDLIEENRRDLARRSGNYDAAGQKTRAAAILRTGEPGYLALTSTNKVRQTLALKRSRGPRGDKGEPELLQTLLQTSKSESAASLVSAAPAKTVVRKNADEAHADRVVLSRMDQKLKFLRNPSAAPRRKRSGGRSRVAPRGRRYNRRRPLPTTVVALASRGVVPKGRRRRRRAIYPVAPRTQTRGTSRARARRRYDPTNANHRKTLTARPPSPRRIGREVFRETDPARLALAEAEFAASGPRDLRETAIVAVEPRAVIFVNPVPGEIYERVVSLRNTSAISRRLRLLRPVSAVFSVAKLKWPGGEDSGTLAPGMAARVLVRFAPSSIADVEDRLIVASETGDVIVPLRGSRDPPKLNLPDRLDAGACLLGGSARATFRATNAGGPGKFRVLPEDGGDDDALERKELKLGDCFAVAPAKFDLASNASIDLVVRFFPDGNLAAGHHAAVFRLVGEDGRSSSYEVSGRAEGVSIRIAELDGVVLEPMLGYAAPNCLTYASLPLGGAFSRFLDVANDGALPLDFEWVLDDEGAGFRVLPSRGALAPKNRRGVEVAFAPPEIGLANTKATLMVRGVPSAAAGSRPTRARDDGLVDVEAYAVVFKGAAHRPRLDAYPSTLVLPAALALGETRDAAPVLLKNPTNAAVAWAWAEPVDRNGETSEKVVDVAWHPSGGVLEPGGSVECVASITAAEPGVADVACRVDAASLNGETHEACRVALRARTSGGRLRFAEPEVDLGLIAVGAKKAHALEFTNTTASALEFSFAEVLKDGRATKTASGDSPAKENDEGEFKIDSPYRAPSGNSCPSRRYFQRTAPAYSDAAKHQRRSLLPEGVLTRQKVSRLGTFRRAF